MCLFGDLSNLNKYVCFYVEGQILYKCDYCGKILVWCWDLERYIKFWYLNIQVKLEVEEEIVVI